MEFCGGGAVNDLMASMPNKTFTEQQIAAIIAESLKGLVLFHAFSRISIAAKLTLFGP